VSGYTYESFERGLWTVGHRDDSGKWHAESDHDDPQAAADRVHYLNGGAVVAARHAAEAGLPPEAAAIIAQAVPELAAALEDFNFERNQVIELRAVVLDMARSIRASMNGGGRIARSEVIDWTARAGVEFDVYAEPGSDQ
jgi:hypothetical protein